jgi:hypothetical protein
VSKGLYTTKEYIPNMLDAFIIDQIRKDEEKKRPGWQPCIPLPGNIGYEPPVQRIEPVRRGYCEIGRGDDENDGRGVVIDMKRLYQLKYF